MIGVTCCNSGCWTLHPFYSKNVRFLDLFIKNTNYDFYRSYGLLIGAGLGILFEEKFINFETNNLTKKNIILRLLIGFSILLILYMGGKLIPVFEEINFLVVIHHFIVSFALFGLIPFIFKKTNI